MRNVCGFEKFYVTLLPEIGEYVCDILNICVITHLDTQSC